MGWIMKHCEACHVQVMGEDDFCPLCGEALERVQVPPAEMEAAGLADCGTNTAGGAALADGAGQEGAPKDGEDDKPACVSPFCAGAGQQLNAYPDLSGAAARYNVAMRIAVFISTLGIALSVLINLLVPTGVWWCLIVVAAVIYAWLTIPPLLRRGANYGWRIVLQAFFTCLLVVALDYITGYNRGWSLSYVVPALLCAGIVAIWLMIVFNRTNWAQYTLFQVIMGVFALVPLLLYFLGYATNLVMVLLAASLGIASILVTVVFADRSVKSEFKRRFHW